MKTLSDKIVIGFIPEDNQLEHSNFIWRKDVKKFIHQLEKRDKLLIE